MVFMTLVIGRGRMREMLQKMKKTKKKKRNLRLLAKEGRKTKIQKRKIMMQLVIGKKNLQVWRVLIGHQKRVIGVVKIKKNWIN